MTPGGADDRLLAGLKKYFGYDDFLDNQRQVIGRIISGNDLCVVMPTGAGKSLCYQLPALLADGFTLVVSPLIALMLDQVQSLRRRGIPAAFINSTVSFAEQLAAAIANEEEEKDIRIRGGGVLSKPLPRTPPKIL